MTKQEKAFIRGLHEPKTRKPTGLCIVEGIRAVSTFLSSPHTLHQLYVTSSATNSIARPYQVISDYDMKTISAAKTPSGILAVFKIHPTTQPVQAGIVCARLQDPGNVGTLIRSCAAFGKKTAVLVESVDPWSPKVIQASAGTIAHVDIHELSWHELIQAQHPSLYALVTHGGTQPTRAHASGLFVVGNEANGIPPEWIKDCDEKITLSMPGNAESLNAAIAGSIALYQTL